METQEKIQMYKHRLRIFLILYFFADEYSDPSNPTYKKLFTSEVRIQKIDFWLRNPDYFSFELLKVAKEQPTKQLEIKNIVKTIFKNKEPIIRREEMEKFRFGAYQDLDDVIAFLDSLGLIKFESKRATNSTVRSKKYFISELAIEKIEKNISSLTFLQWYVDRCKLIKKYFGDKSGTQLKDLQYQSEEYSTTSFNENIKNISDTVSKEFTNLYNETL
jgi:hypothetical protein